MALDIDEYIETFELALTTGSHLYDNGEYEVDFIAFGLDTDTPGPMIVYFYKIPDNNL